MTPAPKILALLLCLAGLHSAAAEREQSRSMVISRTGIAATEQVLASQAAAQILAEGGNAVDAAIAANAVMGVVSPMMCGIGGDLFALVYDARSGQVHGLNASGWSPRALNRDFLIGQGHATMPTNGIHSVTIPGAVDGWDKLHRRFGKKRLSQILRPAIDYAENGFPVSEIVAGYWAAERRKLAATPSAAATFLPSGEPPKTGEIFRNPDLAWSYRQIASRGRRAFYDGPIAARILRFSRANGGTLAPDDLREFSSLWVEPISTTYRGWTVYQIPPNGQGIAALMMLNLMEGHPVAEYGHNSTRALHLMIEAKKLAYADMLQHVADPDISPAPVREMLSKPHAAHRARLIDEAKANCQPQPSITFEAGPDTTYLAVVDQEGNMVSFIQSNYYSFGTGLVPEGVGFVLQNRGGLFTLDPAHPNVLEGRKRPLHTIIPGFMEKGDLRIAFGIMGGWNQAQAHAQFVSKVVDFQMNIQQALDTPRFTKATFQGCDVQLESRIPAQTREELARLGHEIKIVHAFADQVGGGQAVMRDFRARINYGASDPRKDGAAVPEQPRR